MIQAFHAHQTCESGGQHYRAGFTACPGVNCGNAVVDVWLVKGLLSNTGNGATPFSATVS